MYKRDKLEGGAWWPFGSNNEQSNRCDHVSYDCDKKTCKRIKVIEDKYQNGIDIQNDQERSTVLALLAGNGITDHTRASQWIHSYNEEVRVNRAYNADISGDRPDDGADLERFSSAVTGQSPPVSPVQSGDESDNDSELERFLSAKSHTDVETDSLIPEPSQEVDQPVMPEPGVSEPSQEVDQPIMPEPGISEPSPGPEHSPVMPEPSSAPETSGPLSSPTAAIDTGSLTEIFDGPADPTPDNMGQLPADDAPPTLCNSFNQTKLYGFDSDIDMRIFVNADGLSMEQRNINITITLEINPGSPEDGWLQKLIGEDYLNIINQTILDGQTNSNIHSNLSGNTLSFGVNNVKYRLTSNDRVATISKPEAGQLQDSSCEVVMVDDNGNNINPIIDIIKRLQENVRQKIPWAVRPTFNEPELYILYRENTPFTRKSETCSLPCIQVGLRAFNVWGDITGLLQPAKTYILKTNEDTGATGATIYRKKQRTKRKPRSKKKKPRRTPYKKKKPRRTPSKKRKPRRTPSKKNKPKSPIKKKKPRKTKNRR